jgi:hypothetical protein
MLFPSYKSINKENEEEGIGRGGVGERELFLTAET